MANLLIIIVLLIALGITASLLIFIVIKIYLRKNNLQIGTTEYLAKVLDGFPLPVFEIDMDHKVIQWNAALEVLSGIKKSEVLRTNEHWRPFYSDERPILADLIVDQASENEIYEYYKDKAGKSVLIEGAYEAEDHFPTLGGEGKWYHFTASPIRKEGVTIGAIEILEDVTERRQAEQNLRYYADRITRVQEEERKYMARELHDTSVQSLVALIYKLDNFMAKQNGLTETGINELNCIHRELQKAVKGLRNMSRRLRPPVLDDLGLLPVLEGLVEESRDSYGMEIMLETAGEKRRLEPDIELALYRVITEALINSAKHSGVKAASVRIEYMPHNVRVEVTDCGDGFDLPDKIGSLPRYGKLGLAGISERVDMLGGKLQIRSKREKAQRLL